MTPTPPPDRQSVQVEEPMETFSADSCKWKEVKPGEWALWARSTKTLRTSRIAVVGRAGGEWAFGVRAGDKMGRSAAKFTFRKQAQDAALFALVQVGAIVEGGKA